MTSQKSPSTSTMIRRFTQQMRNFRGEVEILDMKMTDLFYDWLKVVEIYDEEKKTLKAKKKTKVISNKKRHNGRSVVSTNLQKPDLKTSDKA